MSTRERWIVYPILFMTLGITLRDKVTYHVGNLATQVEASAITSPRIRCNELQVGKLVCDRVQANQSECRALVVSGPNNKPVVVAGSDSNTHAGVVETYTATGMRQVRLFSSEVGGMVTTIERGGHLALMLGDTGQNFGLFAEIAGLGRLIPLSIPWRFEKKPAGAKPPQSPTNPKDKPVGGPVLKPAAT